MEKEKILSFLNDSKNSHNCKECFYNEGYDDWQNRKPCGQWNCWVDICQEKSKKQLNERKMV